MTFNRCSATQPLAFGVRLPTDYGRVLPRWAPRSPIMPWRGVEHRLACRLRQVCASELAPNRCPRQLLIVRTSLALLYFPL